MNKFSDFAERENNSLMDGKKVGLDQIINKPIIILKYRVKDTKFDDAKNPHCLTVQFEYATEEGEPVTGEHFVFFSGSAVLMEQLETYKDKIPFFATIQKVGKYFTFS
jgi:hypothetical protein